MYRVGFFWRPLYLPPLNPSRGYTPPYPGYSRSRTSYFGLFTHTYTLPRHLFVFIHHIFVPSLVPACCVLLILLLVLPTSSVRISTLGLPLPLPRLPLFEAAQGRLCAASPVVCRRSGRGGASVTSGLSGLATESGSLARRINGQLRRERRTTILSQVLSYEWGGKSIGECLSEVLISDGSALWDYGPLVMIIV